jgi:hypothetical protein
MANGVECVLGYQPGSAEAVRDCALFLDEIRPGWERFVWTPRLDFSSNTWCVVGQVWRHTSRCSYWPEIARRFPKAVMGGRSFWMKEIQSRLATPVTFPEEWTKTRPLVVR